MNQNPRSYWSFTNRPHTFCYRRGGFTLVEIMVVVVIIGIALSAAVANLFPDEQEHLRSETQRLQSVLELARDEAAFTGHAVAFRVTNHDVEFLQRSARADEGWVATSVAGKSRWSAQEGIQLNLKQGNANSEADNNIAVFHPAGVGVPFSLDVVSASGMRTLVSDALGNLSETQNAPLPKP